MKKWISMTCLRVLNQAIFLSVLSICGAGHTFGFQQLTLDEILEKNEDAIGGAGAIQQVKTLRLIATTAFGNSQTTIPVTITLKRPNLGRTDATSQGKNIASGFDGSTAWAVNPITGVAEPAQLDDTAANSLNAFQIDVLLGSVRGMIAGQQIEMLGTESIQGSGAFNVRAIRKNGLVINYFVDSKTFLLVETAARITHGTEVQEIESYPSDYRKLNGLTLSYALEMQDSGHSIFHMQVQQIDLNPIVDDTMFKMASVTPAPSR